jgi:hypothetical protein
MTVPTHLTAKKGEFSQTFTLAGRGPSLCQMLIPTAVDMLCARNASWCECRLHPQMDEWVHAHAALAGPWPRGSFEGWFGRAMCPVSVCLVSAGSEVSSLLTRVLTLVVCCAVQGPEPECEELPPSLYCHNVILRV